MLTLTMHKSLLHVKLDVKSNSHTHSFERADAGTYMNARRTESCHCHKELDQLVTGIRVITTS